MYIEHWQIVRWLDIVYLGVTKEIILKGLYTSINICECDGWNV